MRIMTANIWGDYFSNPVNIRLDGILSAVRTYSPDVLGFQEITDSWYKSGLFEKLSDEYRFFGTRLFDNNNFVPLAVKKCFSVSAEGFEYLSDTPDSSKAVTWASLTAPDGKRFAVCNTHFWWMHFGTREHDAIREKNAHQLSCLMEYLHGRFDCPVFAFGDMNSYCTTDVFRVVYPLHNVRELYVLTENRDDISSHHGDPIADEKGLYHGSRTNKDHTGSIDHIVALGEGFRVLQYRIVTDQAVLDATDHSPVYADIEFD